MYIYSGGDEGIVVIVVVFQPIGVRHFAVSQFSLNLHPSFGEGNVLEVDETGAHLRNGPGVATHDKVAAAKSGVEETVSLRFHARVQEDAPVFYSGPGLAQACIAGMASSFGKPSFGGVPLAVVHIGGVTGRHRRAEAVLEASLCEQGALHTQILLNTVSLDCERFGVGCYVVRRELAGTEVRYCGEVQTE